MGGEGTTDSDPQRRALGEVATAPPPFRARQSGKTNACKEIFLGIFMPQYGDGRKYAHHVAQCKTCEDAITGKLPTVFRGAVPFLFARAKRVWLKQLPFHWSPWHRLQRTPSPAASG